MNTRTVVPMRGDSRIHFAYFAYHVERKRLVLMLERSQPAAAAPPLALANALPTEPSIVYPAGAEGGLVGLVAQTGESIYIADCAREERWTLGSGFGSALLLPVGRDCPCDVVVLSSHEVDGFSARDTSVAATVIECCAQVERYNTQQGARVRHFEQGLRRIAMELSELGVEAQGSGYTYPRGLVEQLRLVSPREWEVLERLRVGLRVTTIASELSISPNTVRNHLKSIYRKLGVRSQLELLERLRAGEARG